LVCDGRPVDDPALIERFRSGDSEAYDEIVGQHRRTVYLVARRILGSHEDADEAAQRAWVRAWKARARFRGDSALRTWLVRIAINVANSMRTGGRRMENLDELGDLPDARPGADEGMGVAQARKSVRRAVMRLPRRQREVVTLKVFSEMTYKETAAAMELSEGAVKAHLHQAVSNLRRVMREFEDGRERVRQGVDE